MDKPCVVASNLITALDWRERKIKKIAMAEAGVFADVILRILQIIGASDAVSTLCE